VCVRRQELREALLTAWQSTPAKTRPASKNLPPSSPLAGCHAHILLAEDNITNQQVALGLLRKFGLRADAVANGAEAVTALQQIPYDLILMDVQMPRMDGLEATRRIRAAGGPNSATPIVALTADIFPETRERCAAAGVQDFLTKPVDTAELAACLQRLVPPQAAGR
jgi:CheY-like chemotaxis protein